MFETKKAATMTTFAELTKQVHLINDLILADITACDDVDSSKAAVTFSKHLLATKYWFARISHANKKRYLLALIHDVRSAWALSLLLKSMWNCRPKDAVLSVSEQKIYTSFDQVPMDHNRTAQPAHTLAQVMKNDRIWFLSLDAESQALVLSELMTVAGGPAMWDALRLARRIFERNRELMLKNIQECIVLSDPISQKPKTESPNRDTSSPDPGQAAPPPGEAQKVESQALVLSELMTVAGGPAMWDALRLARRIFERNRELMLKNIQECIVLSDPISQKPKTESPNRDTSSPDPGQAAPPPGEAQKVLDANLATWNATIKAMRDSLKLEEIEMTFNDGTKRKIWKVNRIKPEVIETVDFVQLLPSSIGKKILSYLPLSQLGDYAKVNKYWVYLVDELRAELAARAKIRSDFERLNDLLLRHDTSLEIFIPPGEKVAQLSSLGMSTNPSNKGRQTAQPSMRQSEKSGGAYSHYSQRQFMSEKLTKPIIIQKPIRNMMDLSERLERRGAADENLWKWCNCILAHAKKIKKFREKTEEEQGVLSLGNVHFPCPLMKVSMDIPLIPPLYKDPIMSTSAKPKRIISESNFVHVPKEIVKRYSLWTRDLSALYRVFKIPSYLSPESPGLQYAKQLEARPTYAPPANAPSL